MTRSLLRLSPVVASLVALAACATTPGSSGSSSTSASASTPAPASQAAPATEAPDMLLLPSSGVTWMDFSSPGFDPGIKLAVLHGNPAGRGDYTIRLMFPDGYKFPVHWHPGAEHVTVLSGSFQLAMGTSGDWSAVRSYGPGDFIYAPARHPHYGGAIGQTVIQLHGDGPFQIMLGSPK